MLKLDCMSSLFVMLVAVQTMRTHARRICLQPQTTPSTNALILLTAAPCLSSNPACVLLVFTLATHSMFHVVLCLHPVVALLT
jgi:hypothetical protein